MKAKNFAIAFIVIVLILTGIKKITEEMERRECERLEQIIQRCLSK